jgi:ABC-type sulfate transport system substrate-binding protein
VTALYSNVPVLDTGARGATTTFVQRGHRRRADRLGERGAARGARVRQGQGRGRDAGISILAEPPVAVVDKVVERHGTRDLAQAYLEFLYTPTGQALAAQHYYRTRKADAGSERAAEDRAVHRRRVVRRLAAGAEDALRGRRGVRPTVHRSRAALMGAHVPRRILPASA